MDHLSPSDVTAMFLSLGILLASARALGELCRRWGQPSVVGEILAGIVLGPTVLGRFAPNLAASIMPLEGNPAIILDGISTLAICLFLMVAGMEVQLSMVWRRGRTALGVAISGFVFPFAAGLLLALMVPYSLGCEVDADPLLFAFFFATAISISALPVIAKTLMDLGLYRSDFGMIVIAAAVFNDLLGWLIFAVILGMLGAEAAHGYGIGFTVMLTIACATLSMTIGRKLINKALPWVQAHTSWPGGVLGFATSLSLLAAALTEWIGIHAIFGAFLVGVMIGDSPHLRTETRRTILDFVSFIFAPLFFASVGLRVDFAEKFYPEVILPILAIACVSKVLGCGLTARLTGLDWNTSWALGVALNARGAMEIILGLLALQNGLIRQRMFVALVILAIVTSIISGPGIQRLLGRRRRLRLTDHLVSNGFRPGLRGTDLPSAMRQLVPLFVASRSIDLPASQQLLAQSAEVNVRCHGSVAIIQARVPGVSRSLLAIGTTSGIVLNGLDQTPVTTVCIILGSELELTEAQTLESEIVQTFSDPATLLETAQAATFTEFLAVIQSRRIEQHEPVLV